MNIKGAVTFRYNKKTVGVKKNICFYRIFYLYGGKRG